MLVVMKHSASAQEIRDVVDMIQEMGYEARPIPGRQRTSVGLIGNDGQVEPTLFQSLPGVLEVIPVSHSYKQVSREWKEESTVVTLPNGTKVGGREIALMAGPCAVESEEMILDLAETLSGMGATILRGGAFKPRTSPYSFQGLGVKGLQFLAKARENTGMAIVTEVVDAETADSVAEYADILQVGARNMQNYPLLRKVGKVGKPILLKRGLSATIEELLLAAEYVIAEGNPNVILCERGVRSFDTQTRNLLDLTAIPVVKSLSHLPIIADPSHGTGVRAKVTPMARAAVAAGADGLMVEVHSDPNHALSDGAQSLYPEQFQELLDQIKVIAQAINREMAPPLKLS
ncbi:MAG: 3-deoxy-7-phosphoheptulonate synthase [Gemmatimonadetes bacterium]|nr:3-deoxy-7-phosphoheptulonate synthase [Gemmatimonadota bacterium]